MLGNCYENGFGTNKDMNKCIDYYQMAVDAGFREA